MKEIRFRAWDTKLNKMWINVQNAYDTLGCYDCEEKNCNCDEKDDYKYPDKMQSFGGVLLDKSLIVMQYIGLKDKNGKNIFEGDIVLFDGEQAIVKWKEDGFIFDRDQKMLPAYAILLLSLRMDIGENLYEVIGNIYENPELITK